MGKPDEPHEHPNELWRPSGNDGLPLDLNNPHQLSYAILNVAFLSDQEVARVVTHLMETGQYYQAARCLEIVAQHRLGLDFSGDELVGHDEPGFGSFHGWIYDLLRSGALYHRSRRPRTAEAAFRRALIFVEEALRHTDRQEPLEEDRGEMFCLGLAFELAGHCCAALEDTSGLDYYQAAESYWYQATRRRPEGITHWIYHPVTQKVISCLFPVLETRPISEDTREHLFTADYQTRLGTAKSLLR